MDDITDLAGLRVITYYDDEIDRVAEVIEKEFRVNEKDSVDKRNIEPDRFGYRAINFVCGHLDKRTSDVEYKRFAGIVCEIQITSILGHAWSEIEHEWYDLREAYPANIKRRFSILAALFELAGREFVDIRESRAKYERAVALQVEANVPDIPVDAVSLRTFVEQEPLVGELDAVLAAALGYSIDEPQDDTTLETRSRLVRQVGISNLQDLRGALKTYLQILPKFMARLDAEVWSEVPAALHVDKGVCIYQLALLLAAAQGEAELGAFFSSFSAKSVPEENKLIHSIASDVIAELS